MSNKRQQNVNIQVTPQDWMTNPETMERQWIVWYRKENNKLVQIKGMNREKNYKARVALTKNIIKEEQAKLNQVKQVSLNLPDGSLGFIKALEKAFSMLQTGKDTLHYVKSTLKYVTQAAKEYGFSDLPIISIRRKHLKILMTHLSVERKWSNRTWNAYRSYLMMLFEELDELEMVDHNPAKALKKKQEDISYRETLKDEQRHQVKQYLIEKDMAFYRFIQIFFHSGGRRTELMNLKIANVDFKEGTYKQWVKKGKKREVKRPIKEVALPYWIEQISNYPADYYVFSRGLLPGPKKIRPEQVTRRWKKHVKNALGIDIDMYSLKHLNTDETARILSLEDAAKQNAHSSTTITRKHYAFRENDRELERLKSVNNPF